MADTLIREATAYGSQPLSPVPQYWDGASAYAKAQGVNGAIRVINYNSAGETFTNAIPGTVQLVTSAGATNLFSGSNPGSVQLTATSTVAISGTSTMAVSGTATVAFSATGTVEILSSAGGTAYFSGTKPASVQLTATSTVNFSGSGTMVISGTATVNFSGSGTVAITGNITADIATLPVVGSANNTWSASATVSAGATSTSVDLRYNYQISYFGTVTNTASVTLALEVSQDNSTFYQAATNTITAGTTSPFHYSATTAARYARLSVSGVSATITATIAGK